MNEVFAYLPNFKGAYNKTRIPQYVLSILKNARPERAHEIGRWGLDVYVLEGVNPVRTPYGIPDDLAKLEKWATRYFANFNTIHINKERKNYYGVFALTDPVQYQLQKVGLL